MAAQPTPRRFTVDEYYRMGKSGILAENDRVELIEGEVFQMPPIGDLHAWCINRLTELFVLGLAGGAIVAVQNPLRLSTFSEPVPDLVVMRRRPALRGPHPTARDVFLVIEVSDTSLRHDQRVKLPIYAREGVPEVWIVDLRAERMLVYRDPSEGGYRISLIVGRSDPISPAAFPELVLTGDQILG